MRQQRKEFHLDFETFSLLNLPDIGAYRYAEDKSTEILTSSFAYSDDVVLRWTPLHHGMEFPEEMREAVEDDWEWHAHNAPFERIIWKMVLVRRYGWPSIPDNRWRCTAARAAAVGYPRSLEAGIDAADLPPEYRKDKRGSDLLKVFSRPRKATRADPRTRIMPEDDPGRFEELREYCDQDVVAERALGKEIPHLPAVEQKIWFFDMQVNDIGMPINVELLKRSERVVSSLEAELKERTRILTSFDGDPANGINPTQREKMLSWLEVNACTLPNLQLDTVRDVLSGANNISITPEVREVLGMRIEASRASTKKLVSMRACGSQRDGRVRGAYLYAGAHTLRWSSKLVQLHNLVRGLDDPHAIARVLEAFMTGDPDFVRLMYSNPMSMLSQCIRGFIDPGPDKELGVVDYSQIEARNLDWHAGNIEGLKEWASGIDKYKLMAMRIFGIDNIGDVTPEQRRIAKNATLGCGFGMSAKAFLLYCHNNGADDVDQDTADLAVGIYREVNEANVKWWADVQNYCLAAIGNPGESYTLRKCTFEMVDHWLTIKIPSGRRIWYPHAEAVTTTTKWGKRTEQMKFLGVRDGMQYEEHTYGAKTVENIVQATSRDIMAHGLMRAKYKGGYNVVGHTHDEGITENPKGQTDLPRLQALMEELEPWAAGMPIKSEGFVTSFYWKG